MGIKSIALGASALILSTSVNAAIVVSDQIDYLYENGSYRGNTVDMWSFSTGGGALEFDIYAYGYNGTYLDSQIFLFNDDGTLDSGDYITKNDDHGNNSDGSTSYLDSYIATNLASGNYILAVARCCAANTDIVDGYQSNTTTPPIYDSLTPYNYQLTLTGDISNLILTDVSAVPVPAAAWLFGSGLIGLIGLARNKQHI